MTNNEELDVFLVAVTNTVLGFKNALNGRSLNITLNPDKTLSDVSSGTVWNIRGKRMHAD